MVRTVVVHLLGAVQAAHRDLDVATTLDLSQQPSDYSPAPHLLASPRSLLTHSSGVQGNTVVHRFFDACLMCSSQI